MQNDQQNEVPNNDDVENHYNLDEIFQKNIKNLILELSNPVKVKNLYGVQTQKNIK